jgi:hypothetical protein
MTENYHWKTRTQGRMTAKPPEIAQRLLRFLLPDQLRDNISGDLTEIFTAVIVPSCGIFRARVWYWRQVVCSMRFFLRFPQSPQAALKGRVFMDSPRTNETRFHRGIRIDRIPVEGAIGLLFVFATVFIFGIGIPAVRELFVITGILGILGSGILLFWHKCHALKLQLLDLHKKKQNH